MGTFGKVAMGVIAGFVVASLSVSKNVDNGTVVYENDDMYVRASENRDNGYSWAKVHYKKPETK